MAINVPNNVILSFILSHQTYAQQGFNQIFKLNISTLLGTQWQILPTIYA